MPDMDGVLLRQRGGSAMIAGDSGRVDGGNDGGWVLHGLAVFDGVVSGGGGARHG